jgi:hypothetical protein
VELPLSLKRALRWSKMLVLIGTSRALDSPHVGFEIREFLWTSGIVIPIGSMYLTGRNMEQGKHVQAVDKQKEGT